MMYKHVVWDFCEKEIEQIVELTRMWAGGMMCAIDRRKYTRQVLDFAVRRGMLIDGAKISRWDAALDCFARPGWARVGRLHFTCGLDQQAVELTLFDPLHDLPQEVLYRIVAPMLDKSTGYSLGADRRWQELATWERGATLHDRRQEDRIYRFLGELDRWGYIIFQHAGDVWQITRTPDRAVRSEWRD